MNGQTDNRAVQGEVLALTQRSVRGREYELRRGDQVFGWLRFPPGRRSTALAEGIETGSITLTARSGRVVVAGGPDAAALIATVERERGGAAVIRPVQGPALRWQRAGRRHRWAIDDGDATLLRFSAAHGLLKLSVRITVQQEIPAPTVVLLCLVGGFLASGSCRPRPTGARPSPGSSQQGPASRAGRRRGRPGHVAGRKEWTPWTTDGPDVPATRTPPDLHPGRDVDDQAVLLPDPGQAHPAGGDHRCRGVRHDRQDRQVGDRAGRTARPRRVAVDRCAARAAGADPAARPGRLRRRPPRQRGHRPAGPAKRPVAPTHDQPGRGPVAHLGAGREAARLPLRP
jgi:hypothetical protein